MLKLGDKLKIKGSVFTTEKLLAKPYKARRNIAVSCSKCSGDIEMFPDKLFEICLGNLKKGYTPCSCSERFRGDTRQKKLRMTRLLAGTTRYLIAELDSNKKELEFKVGCTICSEDKELYPELRLTYSLAKKGVIPCGCASCPNWTEDQNRLRVIRECEKRGYKFLGWSGKYKGNTTKILLSHNNVIWKDNNIIGFLNGADSSDKRGGKISESKTKDDSYFLNNIKSHAHYPFMSDISVVRDNGKVYLEYTCTVCSRDELTLSSVCTGRFKFVTEKIKESTTPCRCSTNYRWNTSQREVKVKSLLNGEGIFKKWTTNYNTCDDRFEWQCKNCNKLCTTSFDKFVYDNNRCPTCRGSGFDKNKLARFYIVRWEGYGESYLKFGITNREVLQRIYEQDTASSHLDYTILHEFFHEMGQSVLDCEKSIKQSVRTRACPKKWLPDGYTETVEDTPENLNKMLEIISTFNLKETPNDPP